MGPGVKHSVNVCIAGMLVLSLLPSNEEVTGKRYPLNIKYTYMFLSSKSNRSDKMRIDTSNPWRFNFIDTAALIELWGYKSEEHKVTTEDGYIISLYRILPKQEGSPPVLVMHGFLACSETFLVRGKPDLAIMLSEAGYDVWLSNFRGNYNGKGHINMTAEDENFWKFSFHEMGLYDLPAFVDFILHRTGFMKMTLLGHSFSNAITMIMTSLRPEYNEKINLLVGMAPFVFASHLRQGPLLEFLIKSVSRYCNKVRKFELLERRPINPIVRICDSIPFGCVLTYLFILGINKPNYDQNLVPSITGYFPSGTSLYTMAHLIDLYRQRRFCQFDYGRDQNLLRYNSEEPPDYDLSRVTIPILLYSGGADFFTDSRDVTRLEMSLPNLIGSHVLTTYNHFDFVISSDTKEVFYDDMMEVVAKYQKVPPPADSITRRPPRTVTSGRARG
ncbi:hypothetical protein M8J76_003013 [Diaphorina citri]|nr:hypothetical protein M8J75_012066 [Diaphorina citri]KAI5732681.1 hypothetical protein M8J76_003013 [Diaphorina citri]